MEDKPIDFSYRFSSQSSAVTNSVIAKNINDKFKKHDIKSITRTKFEIDTSGMNPKKLLQELGDFYELTKMSSFVFTDNFIYYVYQTTKCNISILELKIYSLSDKPAKEAIDNIRDLFSDFLIDEPTALVEWYHHDGDQLDTYTTAEILDDKVYKESYPNINLDQYISDFLQSDERVLFMRGKPGTGKTRLIRYIIRKIADRKTSDDASFLFTNQKKVIKNGKIFQDFIRYGEDGIIIEDMDSALEPRENGNHVLATVLEAADGIVRLNSNGKIIITTNLTDINHIDEALIRPGRCFDKLKLRSLTYLESKKLLNKLNCNKTLEEEKEYTLAELYRIVNGRSVGANISDQEVGFQ